MRRWLFNFASTLSLLLCLGLIASRVLGIGVTEYQFISTVQVDDGPAVITRDTDVDDTLFSVRGRPVRYSTLIAATALLPLAWLLHRSLGRYVHRYRSARGLCPRCGYDLRATRDRCPECGAVPDARPLNAA